MNNLEDIKLSAIICFFQSVGCPGSSDAPGMCQLCTFDPLFSTAQVADTGAVTVPARLGPGSCMMQNAPGRRPGRSGHFLWRRLVKESLEARDLKIYRAQRKYQAEVT